ncbi:hypothetical protein RHSIM_Rhsim01G0152300 [Rhododendron simsii]|uniref:Uncharacterized protein n=1 Tax=Rhododendron simsii TaxID=118357 RepID=A0A834LU36_RHOSS|nr:hypothetical protein RHSIM_Rhsim01G0152300 [Rhododendron simsii]
MHIVAKETVKIPNPSIPAPPPRSTQTNHNAGVHASSGKTAEECRGAAPAPKRGSHRLLQFGDRVPTNVRHRLYRRRSAPAPLGVFDRYVVNMKAMAGVGIIALGSILATADDEDSITVRADRRSNVIDFNFKDVGQFPLLYSWCIGMVYNVLSMFAF